jgi:lytic murein transglycosylase
MHLSRRSVCASLAVALAPRAAFAQNGSAELRAFLDALWPDVQKRGISRATFDEAFSGVTLDPRLIPLTRRQPESVTPIGKYLAGAVSVARISEGQRKAKELGGTLEALEARTGVDRYVILSIWAMETNFGAIRPRFDVIRSLATLAQARFRDDFFRDELIAALMMLQNGHVPRAAMLGSWAGAMGQPQFMPSSYLKYAASFSQKGFADIWTSMPDVLASIANFLKESGWQPKRIWGFEVVVPQGFDYRKSHATLSAWSKLGVARADGAKLSGDAEFIMFLPGGWRGPAFLVSPNYDAIKKYNISDHYTMAVGHMADRMRGLPPIKGKWTDEVPLPRDERIALQRMLAARGYTVSNFQGYMDFPLRDAIRAVQAEVGLVPDGVGTPELMAKLRAAAR